MIYDLSKPLDRNNFKLKARQYYQDSKIVELKLKRKSRSISQNSYLHVVITLFAIEYGDSIEAMKQMLKYWYGLYEERGGAIVYGKTSEMDTAELSIFIEWIRNKSSKDLGYYIPTSEEYIENQAEVNRLINQNKQYT